jgi:hypothetical protein
MTSPWVGPPHPSQNEPRAAGVEAARRPWGAEGLDDGRRVCPDVAVPDGVAEPGAHGVAHHALSWDEVAHPAVPIRWQLTRPAYRSVTGRTTSHTDGENLMLVS